MVLDGRSPDKIKPCNNCPIGQKAVIDKIRSQIPDTPQINTIWIYDFNQDGAPEYMGTLYISITRLGIFGIRRTFELHADFNSGLIDINEHSPMMRNGRRFHYKFPPIIT